MTDAWFCPTCLIAMTAEEAAAGHCAETPRRTDCPLVPVDAEAPPTVSGGGDTPGVTIRASTMDPHMWTSGPISNNVLITVGKLFPMPITAGQGYLELHADGTWLGNIDGFEEALAEVPISVGAEIGLMMWLVVRSIREEQRRGSA